MSELVLEYWTVLQLSFHHHLTLYLTEEKMMVIYKLQSHIKRAWATTCHSRFRVVARDTAVQASLSHHLSYQIQSCSQTQQFKQAWATICHSRFRVVARDTDAHEHAFGWWSTLNHLCEVELLPFQRIRDTSSSRRLQLHANFGRVPGNASSIPELVVILKPPQVETSIFKLRFSLFMRVVDLPFPGWSSPSSKH